MNACIIERPDQQSTAQKIIYGILTLGWWLFWFYLWLPLIGPWISDHPIMNRLVSAHKYTPDQYWILVDLFIIVGIAALIISIVMGVWGYYNLRNPGRERRRRPAAVCVNQLARFFVVKDAQVMDWHQARRLVVHYDEQGVIQHVEAAGNVGATVSAAAADKVSDIIPGAMPPTAYA